MKNILLLNSALIIANLFTIPSKNMDFCNMSAFLIQEYPQKKKTVVQKKIIDIKINNLDSCSIGFERIDMSPALGFSSIGIVNDTTIVISDTYFNNLKIFSIKDSITSIICKQRMFDFPTGQLLVKSDNIYLLSALDLKLNVYNKNLDFIKSITSDSINTRVYPEFVYYKNEWYICIYNLWDEYCFYSINTLEKQFCLILKDDDYIKEFNSNYYIWNHRTNNETGILSNIYGIFKLSEPLPYLEECEGTNYAFFNDMLYVIDDSKCFTEGKYELIIYYFD